MQTGASFSVGDVLGKAFSTYFRNLPSLLLIAIIIDAPAMIYGLVVGVPTDSDAFTTYTVISSIMGLVLWAVMTAALMYLVVEDLNGRRAGIGACLRIGVARALPTLAVSILWYLCIGIGAVLFVIPGIIAWCFLFVAVPASVIERPGVLGALGRSTELTKGHRWQIFGLSIVFMLILFAFFMLVGIVLGTTGYSENVYLMNEGDWAVRVLANAVMQVIVFAFGSVLSATTYVALRNDKDGVGATDLAKVFE